MMVDVFVHENGPLMRIERTKERMWVLGTASCARIGKAIDSSDELGALALEVALCEVRREEFRRGGRVTAHRLIIAEGRGLRSGPMTLAGKDARLGLMTPIAIRMPEVQCARVWVGVMLPHNRSLSG